jgi:hypothetical protein
MTAVRSGFVLAASARMAATETVANPEGRSVEASPALDPVFSFMAAPCRR